MRNWPAGLSSILLMTALAAQEPSAADVAELVAEIEALQASLIEARQAQTQAEQRLEQTELEILQTQRLVRQTQAQLAELEQQRSALIVARDRLETEQQKQRQTLEIMLVQAYRAQRSGELKLWLSPGSMSEQARLKRLFDDFSEAQRQQLMGYLETLADLDQVRTELAAQTTTQQQMLAQLTAAQEQLVTQRAQRQDRLVEVAAQITTQEQALAARQAERAELERLISAMEARLSALEWQLEQRPIEELRGQLSHPVVGDLLQRFGQRSGRANLPSEGVLFAANDGDRVSAVHEGRVVFADYLKGYGLLLILDHGEGYLSLYGRNQGLMRDMGDWVQAGEVIAEVGNTGGFNQTGLYFELRLHGRPLDPMQWLR